VNYYAPKKSAKWKLKKSKSLGLFWSYQLDSYANPAHLPQKWAK
jgi:hypothetical protein